MLQCFMIVGGPFFCTPTLPFRPADSPFFASNPSSKLALPSLFSCPACPEPRPPKSFECNTYRRTPCFDRNQPKSHARNPIKCNTYSIRVCNSFRRNTYKKPGGRGVMLLRMLVAVIPLLLPSASLGWAQSRSVEGTYTNYALGYSIRIPRGLKGVLGDQSGPERGPRISLPSGGDIVVFGEPNSLEWKSPEEGVKAQLAHMSCASGRTEVKPTLVGRLNGAKGRSVCGDHVSKRLLAFRPHGGPIYWLRLDTTSAHEFEDELVLEKIAASFKLTRWR
jgi:hypothetical protein